MQKEFLGYVFSARRNSNFREKWVTKIELQNRHLFSSNFEFCKNISIFRRQSQVFTITRQKYDRYMTPSKKIRPLAPKCAKLEHF